MMPTSEYAYRERKVDKNWRDNAACNKLNNFQAEELFWIGPGKSANQARKFCSTCPVKQTCRNYAIMYNERGIWGGTTEEERDSMDPWIRERLREIARQEGELESRNIAEFVMPKEVKQTLLIDLDLVDSVLQQVAEMVFDLDLNLRTESDTQMHDVA